MSFPPVWMPASPSREELSRPIKVFEAGAIARLDHDARPFGGLMAGGSAVFTAATAFSVRMIMGGLADAFAEPHAWAVPEKENFI